MNRTKIEYVDYTWNPVTGCTKGCEYCYARRLAQGRLKRTYLESYNWVAPGCNIKNPFSPRIWPGSMSQPKEVKKSARILVCSMGDLFDITVPDLWIDSRKNTSPIAQVHFDSVLDVVRDCPQHTFLFLTKQPARMAQFEFPENAWCGVSVENDEVSAERIKHLHGVKANTKYVSFEPLLEHVYFFPMGIDWIIIGAMTGKNATKPKQEWVQYLITKADRYKVSVFLKDNLSWPERRQEFPKEG